MADRDRDIIVVLEDIHDPHNAAAILRTCDAFGIQNVWFVFEKEKSYNPKRVGKASSSSANKWLDFRTFKSTAECLETLASEGFRSLATTIHEPSATSFYDFDFSKGKLALWVGNEHRGLSETAIEGADERITIPMRGFVESLNVSVTAAVFVSEAVRQRRR